MGPIYALGNRDWRPSEPSVVVFARMSGKTISLRLMSGIAVGTGGLLSTATCWTPISIPETAAAQCFRWMEAPSSESPFSLGQSLLVFQPAPTERGFNEIRIRLFLDHFL